MKLRLPAVLSFTAAIALAVAPVVSWVDGRLGPRGLIYPSLVVVITWGFANSRLWAKVGAALLTLPLVWRSIVAWLTPPAYQSQVPHFLLWRTGRSIGLLLLVAAFVASLLTGDERPESTSSTA
jgi:hypothetical protein